MRNPHQPSIAGKISERTRNERQRKKLIKKLKKDISQHNETIKQEALETAVLLLLKEAT